VRTRIVALSIVTLCLTTAACRKLEDRGKPTGPLVFETSKFPDAVPQEYGPLIAVTQGSGEWATLWFQKQDGTITLIGVNIRDGRLGDKLLTIPRK
jgi:hypothetical protein